MDIINQLIDTYNFPLLTAFLLGILTSINPCPLMTNITAVAYISKEIKTLKNTLLNGLFYSLGRGLSYILLTTLIYFGLSSFQVSGVFQDWGDKALGPILIIFGLMMLGVIKLPIKTNNELFEKLKGWISVKGYIGSMLLGALFALAFCPYSAVLFFGVLIPLVLKSQEALLLPVFFAFGTGLPVIIVSFVIAFSVQKINQSFSIISNIEKVIRFIVTLTFIIVGIYYMRYLVIYLMSLLGDCGCAGL